MKLSRFVLLLPAALLVGCDGYDPVADAQKRGSVHGRETRWVEGYGDGQTSVSGIAKRGDVIRRQIRLGASQAEIMRSLAQRKFDGYVATEMQFLQPKYEAKKRAVRSRTQKKVNSIRAKASVGRITAAEADQQIRSVEADTAQEVAKIDTSWRKEALARAEKKHGEMALPLARGGEYTVVPTSIRGGVAQTPTVALELNVDPRSLGTVRYEGRQYAVVN